MIPLPSPEELVARVIAFNNAWHFFRKEENRDNLPEWGNPLIEGMRETKAGIQLLLLREYHERGIWLEIDPEQTQEPIYSVRLSPPIAEHPNACHLPKRIAEKYLTDEELARFTKPPEPR